MKKKQLQVESKYNRMQYSLYVHTFNFCSFTGAQFNMYFRWNMYYREQGRPLYEFSFLVLCMYPFDLFSCKTVKMHHLYGASPFRPSESPP